MRKKDVVSYFGGPSAVAHAINDIYGDVTRQAVNSWGKNPPYMIPEKQALRLARMTKGDTSPLIYSSVHYLSGKNHLIKE